MRILPILAFFFLAACGAEDSTTADTSQSLDAVDIIEVVPDTPGLDLPKGFTGKKDLH
jgi:hypothetical protein